jgi:hypothetical protein
LDASEDTGSVAGVGAAGDWSDGPARAKAADGPAERVELLTGRSLDNCKEILDFPMEAAVLSPALMNGKCQVIRSILTAIMRVGLDPRV